MHLEKYRLALKYDCYLINLHDEGYAICCRFRNPHETIYRP